ncbi:MAG: putative virulence factor [Bacteroidales bacterium]|nr:putative virulence factor [Bacteroidales bacterium]
MDKKSIESQLSANAKALEWGRVYLRGQELESFRNDLISNRIKLKRLLYASEVNPAAAVFGESQVGKSYMVDCLLTSDTEVLNIYDGQGQPTGFIKSINPLGGGKEATSLITRFTAKKVWIDPDYPIQVSMLSPIDVVTVMVDTYYNDVINHNMPKLDAIKDEIEQLKRQYQSLPTRQTYITEDEIYELRDYVKSNLVLRCDGFRANLIDCKYFEELALLINKIDIDRWGDVFSFLWNKQQIVTNIFNDLIATLKKMSFCRIVYIQMDAVLRDTGTILQVDRFYELFGITQMTDDHGNTTFTQQAAVPDMNVLTSDGQKLTNIKKSEFCALASELCFLFVDPNKDNTKLLEKKPFLEYSDILDFPGARSREMFNESTISVQDVCNMALRGKIAYLFNKYSQQYLITNLLFCHHDLQSNVVTLSSLLKGWVDTTVGETAQAREEFMTTAEIPPLFIIGTKFNSDLAKTQLEKEEASEAEKKSNKEFRWIKRFDILTKLIGVSPENDWFSNWTPGHAFKNLYLLRSYGYSCTSGVFEGYNELDTTTKAWKLVKNPDGTVRGETRISDEYENFIKDLKDTFINDKFVKEHFVNPEISWKMAVCEGKNPTKEEVAAIQQAKDQGKSVESGWVGRDGSEWIITNLTKSSKKTTTSRENQFKKICNETFDKLVSTLYNLYHDDKTDLELRKQIQTAGMIALTFDTLFGQDKYFFSDFISSMIIGEEDLHDLILNIINNLKVVEKTDLSKLFAIRDNAKVDNNLSFDENVARIMKAYCCATPQSLEERLNEMGVKLEDIINPPKVMNFSRLICEGVENKWINTRLTLERYADFIKRGLREKELKELLENMRALYVDKLMLSDMIAAKIHPLVSSAISVDDMTDMLADICAEMINKFINTVGAAYYDDEMWKNIKTTIEHNGFEIDLPNEKENVFNFDEELVKDELPGVFETFDNIDKILNEFPVDHKKLLNFSNYIEYYKWREYMRVSFLATQGIPKYDVNMNNALRTVLVDGIIQQEPLHDMVAHNNILSSLESVKVNENN